MKLSGYEFPHSSFLSVEKDLDIIVKAILKNDRLKKLLYYTTEDALEQKSLTTEESMGLFNKNIKIVPKLQVEPNVLNYLLIGFDNFSPNNTNPEFRDNVLFFDIICHFNQWNLGDFKLRPYKIAAELDTVLNDKHLSGIGTLEFMGANNIVLNDEFGGITLMYQAIHGEDDKKHMINPSEQLEYNSFFDDMINNI